MRGCVGLWAVLALVACAGAGGDGDGGSSGAPRVRDAGTDAELAARDQGASVDLGALDAAPEVDGGALDVEITDAAPRDDAALRDDDAAPRDAAPPRCERPAPAPPDDLPRGLAWVRENPMFLSALTVRMGPPPPAFVDAYFDDFGATAVHLWQWGLPDAMDGWRQGGDVPFVSWVDAEGRSRNREILGGYPPDVPGRIGYQVGDEPRTLEEYDQIEEGLAAVRQRDPGALRILNYSFLADDLDVMLRRGGASDLVDVVSMDTYSFDRDHYGRLAIFRETALAHEKPYWRYINACESCGADDDFTRSDMRWHALSGFVYGYTGVTWFLYQIGQAGELGIPLFGAIGDFGATPRPPFDWAAELNRWMRHLGRAITRLTSLDVRYMHQVEGPLEPLAQPEGTRPWAPGAGGDPYLAAVEASGAVLSQDLLLGFLRDDADSRYVIVQNPNHTHGDLPTNNEKPAAVRLVFDLSGDHDPCLDPDSVLALDHRSGRVEARPLVAGALEFDLAPGDVLLLKYRDGVPFAGYDRR